MSKHKRTTTLHKHFKQLGFVVVKLAIVVLASYFMYDKLINNGILDLEYFKYLIENHRFITFNNISFLLLLSLLNWTLECLKWKLLVNEVAKISFNQAATQSLSSLTASIITPNRIGEYGAKAMYFSKKIRKKILGLNLIGNLTQMLATIVFGCFGLIYFTKNHSIPYLVYRHINIFKVMVVTSIFVGIIILINKKNTNTIISNTILFLKKLKRKTILITLLIGVIKYVVFSHQFYFLISIFKLNISYYEAMSCIFSMYIITSIIPTIFILDTIVKSSVAIWLFSYAGINELIVAAITLIMWGVNFAIPAIIGSYFVLRFKPYKD
jgi:hypothetical protein